MSYNQISNYCGSNIFQIIQFTMSNSMIDGLEPGSVCCHIIASKADKHGA